METALTIVIILVFIKSLLIGNEFSFYYWLKHGKVYDGWYFNRETFKEFLEKNKTCKP